MLFSCLQIVFSSSLDMRINCPLTTSIVETLIANYFKIEFDTTEFNDSNSTFPFHFYVYHWILSTKKNYRWWNFIANPFHILNYILTLFSNEILEEQPSFLNFDCLDSIRSVKVYYTREKNQNYIHSIFVSILIIKIQQYLLFHFYG